MPLPLHREGRRNPREWARFVRSSAMAWRAFRAGRFDLVYLSSSACVTVAPLARALPRTRVILHVQEPWTRAGRMRLRMMSAACTRILAISQTVLTSTGMRRSRRVSLLPGATPDHGADAAGPGPGTDSTLRVLPRYVVASRWARGTGYPTLLRAWDDAGCPGELIILSGPPLRGPALDVPFLVRSLVSRPDTVSIIGEVPDVADFLVDADAIVVPAEAPEGLGLAVIEAGSRSRPGIASRSGGPEELIHDRVTGWLFEPGNSDELAVLFRSLTRSELARAGIRARELYERQHTVDLLQRRLRAVIDAELSHNF